MTHLSFDTADQMIKAAHTAEALGFEGALVSYPPSFRPKSATEIVAFTKQIADATDLALILFGVATWGFRALHASQFPPDALEQMARFPTAATIKYEANAPGMISGLADILRRCGKEVIVQCPLEQYAPGLVDWYGMQWMGTSAYDSFGDRVPTWFRMLHEGKWNEAMELYWSYQPGREAKGAFHASFNGANLIHRPGWKYLSWLHGFNGGLAPDAADAAQSKPDAAAPHGSRELRLQAAGERRRIPGGALCRREHDATLAQRRGRDRPRRLTRR